MQLENVQMIAHMCVPLPKNFFLCIPLVKFLPVTMIIMADTGLRRELLPKNMHH